MTPLGHVAVGVVLGHGAPRQRHWAPWVVALGAALPDVDFVLVWSRHFNEWHRVITHNLMFVLMSSLVLAWPVATRSQARFAAVALALSIGGLSHLLLDACLDANASNGIGVALWWPFDDRMVSPINLVDARSDGGGWNQPLQALAAAARGLVWELPWIAAAAVLVWRARRSR